VIKNRLKNANFIANKIRKKTDNIITYKTATGYVKRVKISKKLRVFNKI